MCSSPFRVDMSRRVINPPVHRLLQDATVLLDRGRIPSVPMSVSNNVNAVALARLTASRLKRPRLRGMALPHTMILGLVACRSQLAFGLIPKGTLWWGQRRCRTGDLAEGRQFPNHLALLPFASPLSLSLTMAQLICLRSGLPWRTAKTQSCKAYNLPTTVTCPFPSFFALYSRFGHHRQRHPLCP